LIQIENGRNAAAKSIAFAENTMGDLNRSCEISVQTAVIGGTGFETALLDRFGDVYSSRTVDTQYGSVEITVLTTEIGRIGFLPRHGLSHGVAPHNVNHRANIDALAGMGVRFVFSTAAVGSLKLEIEPGDIVVPDDFIDLRGGGATTFFDAGKVVHTDFSHPFDLRARELLLESCNRETAPAPLRRSIIHPTGVYVCASGPRYETPAEVRCYAALGGDVVGMTVAPEAILAREAGLGYASICVATNYGTGLSPSPLSHSEVEQIMAMRRPMVASVLVRTVRAACEE
jgi:5'-methylthioadenosine phosphorylase